MPIQLLCPLFLSLLSCMSSLYVSYIHPLIEYMTCKYLFMFGILSFNFGIVSFAVQKLYSLI